ncbi:MAG: hypothetical protein ACJAZP_000798 [Psychromonas sp.]|jgi:hypothetical protein
MPIYLVTFNLRYTCPGLSNDRIKSWFVIQTRAIFNNSLPVKVLISNRSLFVLFYLFFIVVMLFITTANITPSNTTPIVDNDRQTTPVSPMYPQIPIIDTVVPRMMQIKAIINAVLFKFILTLHYLFIHQRRNKRR